MTIKRLFRRVAFIVLPLPMYTAAGADAIDTYAPYMRAFNRGTYDGEVIREAVSQGVAEVLQDNSRQTVVRHFYIESFETDKAATRKLITVFALCQSTFDESIPPPPKAFNHLVIDYVNSRLSRDADFEAFPNSF